MHRYSEFTEQTSQLPGDKTSIEEVLNREIEVHGFRIFKSKYKKNTTGDYLTIQFTYVGQDNLKVLFTGSDVLINQSKDAEAHLPFIAKIIKVNKYYSFS